QTRRSTRRLPASDIVSDKRSGQTSMDVRQAPITLGVDDHPLSVDEAEKLDRDGHLPFSNILTTWHISRMAAVPATTMGSGQWID
ncbi:MAG TPA: hypothetical protein VJ998_03880, partial [Pseudomonadales bacterium]|nr:hypothetical protein [Pseudomonadales bacterium]